MGVPAYNFFRGSQKIKQPRNWSLPSQSGICRLGTALQGSEKGTGTIYHMQQPKTDTRFLYPKMSVQCFL